MKKIAFVSAFALFFLALPVLAQDDSSNSGTRRGALQEKREGVRERAEEKKASAQGMREETRKRMEERKTEARELRGEVKDERKARQTERIERRMERIEAFFERVLTRLDAAILRFEKFADRIDSRIAKLESMHNIDQTTARENLEFAKVKIGEAKTAIDNARNVVNELLVSENPREAFGSVRDLIGKTIEATRAAHKALVEALREVKASSGKRTGDGGENGGENN